MPAKKPAKTAPIAPAPAPAPARRRDAVATRQAVLDSARSAFARLGYDGAGLREIAAGAGVTAMMVLRYFGNKEALFKEAVTASMLQTSVVLPKILAAGATGRDVAMALIRITSADDTPLEGFQIMLRSAASIEAAQIARELIEAHHQKAIATAMGGAGAPQRAALMLSLIAGLQVMRQNIGLSPLVKVRPEVLADALAPMFQVLLDGNK